MTSTELAVSEPRSTFSLSTEQLKFIANTEFVPKSLRGNLPAIMACVATGRELGIGDMMALKEIYLIDGSPTYSAELMVMLIRRAGHSIEGTFEEGSSTVVGTRKDNGDTMTVKWTMAMAERAGLAKKQNWRQYPESMLWARAVAQLSRMLFADCFAGATHTPEELGEDSSDEGAVNRSTEEGPRSPTPSEGGSGDQAPGMRAPTPEPGLSDEDREFPPVDANGEIIEPGSRPVITDAQRKRLWTIATDANVPEPRLRELVRQYAGVESTKLIPRDCYEPLCEAVMAEVFSPPEESFEERAARAQATRDAT